MRRIAIALLFPCCLAAQEPLGFKGIILGADRAAMPPGGHCLKPQTPAVGDEICMADPAGETIGGAKIQSLNLIFVANRLGAMHFKISHDEYEKAAAALKSRYGPGAASDASVTNRMGAKFTGIAYNWNLPGGTITAKPYAGKVTESSITYQSPEYLDYYKAAKPEADKANAADF